MILLDTHALVWSADNKLELGVRSRGLIASAQDNNKLYVSAITPWEITMLVGKGRLELSRHLAIWMPGVISQPGIMIAPLTPEIGMDAGLLPPGIHGDPADRIIIATARALHCPVLTADGKILRYAEAGHLHAIDARH
ncbi:type II toxin-antitoxin system VapC family toxin [uncultured Sphingomonas sp.]|uniref:type II toxin-antitoxin system VapC family toxin n=1 Tax=uncultured Sphingomonas sp. TaxID=158754 RepID=UPI0035CA2CA0